MADVTAYMGVDPALADVRREQAVGFGETKFDIAKSAGDIGTQINGVSDVINSDIKDTAWKVNEKVGYEADRIDAHVTSYFIAQQQRDAAAALELAKLAVAVDKNAELSSISTQKYVSEDGEKTRALINDLKNADLNRMLIERNSDINYYRNDCNRWEGLYGNGQFAQLASQINALQSNLAETRQGLYNFGTMAGVGQSSTQNQVR